jgi:hypothetical protein
MSGDEYFPCRPSGQRLDGCRFSEYGGNRHRRLRRNACGPNDCRAPSLRECRVRNTNTVPSPAIGLEHSACGRGFNECEVCRRPRPGIPGPIEAAAHVRPSKRSVLWREFRSIVELEAPGVYALFFLYAKAIAAEELFRECHGGELTIRVCREIIGTQTKRSLRRRGRRIVGQIEKKRYCNFMGRASPQNSIAAGFRNTRICSCMVLGLETSPKHTRGNAASR